MKPLQLQGIKWIVVEKVMRAKEKVIGHTDGPTPMVPQITHVVDTHGAVVPWAGTAGRNSYMSFATEGEAQKYIDLNGL